MIRALTSALLLSLALIACVKRTPCDQTQGWDACSMIPRRTTCSCDGRIEPARPSDQPAACGTVRTMCVGDVTATHEPPRPGAPLQSDAGAASP